MENTENVIDFISGQRTATVSFTNSTHIKRMKELHEKFPDEFKYFIENQDGSICAKVPLKWIKVQPPKHMPKRELTEEQREELRQRMAKARQVKDNNQK